MAGSDGLCFFVSDLHGKSHRYEALFRAILHERPEIVLLGGDLLPLHGAFSGEWKGDFIRDFLNAQFQNLKQSLKDDYPQVFLILGNDDPKTEEAGIEEGEQQGVWTYLHNKKTEIHQRPLYGYACVPPTPFRLKDWERYDVSRYADPGCIEPPEGWHSTPVSDSEVKYSTIEKELNKLAGKEDLSKAVFLFHTPPYHTNLDRAALDGKAIDHAPLDVHVGSIAVRRFIETRQPLLTLHGHIHESTRITGSWKDRIGRTWMFSAAHDGAELALVRFRIDDLDAATRELL
ncbi:MAG TPA: metallophosphoesterase [Acidobacteriota bacterium]|nr:metallophosphoesterase [Acidobacteriota bacterium]